MEDRENRQDDFPNVEAKYVAPSNAMTPATRQSTSGSGFASVAAAFLEHLVDYIPGIAAPTGDYKQPVHYDPDDPFRGVVPEKGDVLVVSRNGGLYQHYGVYLGGGRVMHYAAENSDFGGHITIHEADLTEFQGPSDRILVLDFPGNGELPAPNNLESPLFDILRAGSYHLYSPEETVARARQKEGQEKYGLPWNNCEHFALWAKTGVHESRQVNAWATRIVRWILEGKRRR